MTTEKSKEEKIKNLLKLQHKINEKLGLEIIKKASEHKIVRLDTDIMVIDFITGGIPRGSKFHIWGAQHSGKTSLAFAMIAGIQRKGGVACYLDFEHSAQPEYMKSFGINMDELFFAQPRNMEEGLEFVKAVNGNVDIIVIDSIVALGIKVDEDKSMDENMKMAGSALKISEFFKQLLGKLNNETSPFLVLINQTRSNVGVTYGQTTTYPGGNALKHAVDFSINLRRMSEKEWPTVKVNGKETVIGKRFNIKVDKSKLNGNTNMEIAFNLLHKAPHIDNISSITDIALEKGLITRSGVTTSYYGIKFIGFDNFKTFVNNTPELQEIMRKHILENIEPGDLSYFQDKKENKPNNIIEQNIIEIEEDTKKVVKKSRKRKINNG